MLITRRQLLYAMLAALGLAALSGVAAILISDGDVVWRIAGTSLMAAIAAAIMMPMAAWADKPSTRLAGLLGMSLAVVELLLAAFIIWGTLFPTAWREFVAFTAGILAGCGLVVVAFVREHKAEGWKLAWRVGVIGVSAAGLVFLVAAFEESFSALRDGEKLFYSGMSLFWSVLLSAVALIGWARPDPRVWRWVGVAGGATALAMVLYSVWIKEGDQPGWLAGAYSVAAVVAHAVLCLRVSLTPGQRWVRWGAMAAAGATGVFTTLGFTENTHNGLGDMDPIWRMNAAAGLVCISASMALVVFGRLNKKPAVELKKVSFDHVSLTCPRCAKKLTIPTGGALCDGCKLHINVSLAGTQCTTCGYDLTDLKTDKCPECGTVVRLATKGMMDGAEG